MEEGNNFSLHYGSLMKARRSWSFLRRFTSAGVATLFVAALFLPPFAAEAARPAWEAKEKVRAGGSVELFPGDTATFTIAFTNTGAKTWTKDGKNYVSVYTYTPRYRDSLFADGSWLSTNHPTVMNEKQAKTNEVATFNISLTAPEKPGMYHETFILGAEHLLWIPKSQFTVDIVVKDTPKTNIYGETIAPGFRAARLLVSDDRLALKSGEAKEFRVGFKNTGKYSWTKTGARAVLLRATNGAAFHSAAWANQQTAAQLTSDEVKPGQLALFSVTLTAPQQGGEFVPRFVLSAGDDIVDGGEVEIPVQVTQNQLPASVAPAIDSEFAAAGPRGPIIRVGLYEATGVVRLASSGTYQLIEGVNDTPVRQLSGVTSVAFNQDGNLYTVTSGDYVFTSDHHVKFVPDDPNNIFQMLDYENRPTWDPSLNFNQFRGSISVWTSVATHREWVIEELPLEDYMRGLAETSNGSHPDFQRALVTAARTYALFVLSIGGKHEKENFDVNTTGNDQVYKGYVSELVRPNVVAAAEATRGQVVTYNGELVVTPYYSRSDGRTRAWTEVWGGRGKPWLVSVPAPYDVGKTLWGHGVGMSASDAVGRANSGVNWIDILKYYYTGTEVRQLY